MQQLGEQSQEQKLALHKHKRGNELNDETTDELRKRRDEDKKVIQEFGEKAWDKCCKSMNEILDADTPHFFNRSDKRVTDQMAHIKNTSAAIIQTVNAMTKASQMRNGILGKDNINDEVDEAERIDYLLKQVKAIQHQRGEEETD